MDNSYPKLRADLIAHAEEQDGQTIYIIKDPLSGRFFRLRAPEYYLLTRADGRTSPADAARQTSERFGIRLEPDAVAAFFARMERLLFFEGVAVERLAARTSRFARRRSLWTITVTAFDPDAFVARCAARLRFLFRPAAVAAGVSLMGFAATLVAVERATFGAGFLELWRLTALPLLLVAVGTLALIHEFGHALTLKHYGGAVHEMGFLLLYFQPCFYCNVSDAYLLPGRRPRILVGLAGLFFQCLLTALAVILWRLLEPGSLAADFLWALIAVSLALILFNLNPLIKLDGYYILVDWLRLPNLRTRAFAYWRTILSGWLLGRATDAPEPRRLRRIYFWYGIAAAAYTSLLLGWLLFHLTRFVHQRWGGGGVIILYAGILALAWTRRRDDGQEAETTAKAGTDEAARPVPRRRRKPLLIWGALALAILLLAIIPAQRRVGSTCEVEASSRFIVTAPSQGTIETTLMSGGDSRNDPRPHRERAILQATTGEFSVIAYNLRVREADSVRPGDTVLVLSSNLYRVKLATAIAQQQRVEAERNLLLSGPKRDAVLALRAGLTETEALVENRRLEMERARRMWQSNLISEAEFETKRTALEVAEAQREAKSSELALLISAPKAEELAVKEAEIAALAAEIDFLRAQIAASAILSPIAGTVTRIERGGTLVEVANLDPVRLHVWVGENDIADVPPGAPVALKVRGLPFHQFHGRVTQIAADADTLSAKRRFLITSDIGNPKALLKPGMSGYAKIACGRRPILALLARRLIQFFRVEFWSWW